MTRTNPHPIELPVSIEAVLARAYPVNEAAAQSEAWRQIHKALWNSPAVRCIMPISRPEPRICASPSRKDGT
jgi:hypothetical protein